MRQQIQLEVIKRLDACAWCAPSKPGDVLWVGPDAARHLLEAGICRYIGGAERAVVGPSETQEAGPSAVKECGARNPFALRRPDGWPIDRFSVVERVWAGRTVALIGGGPSLTQAQVEAVEAAGIPAIAINTSYRIAHFAEIAYFADFQFWEWHKDRPEFVHFRGQKCTIEGTGMMVRDPAVHMLHQAGFEGLSEQPNGICTGMHSGFQVLNIAVLAGAKRVLLLGYDMKFQGERTHWHEGHPAKTAEQTYGLYATRFKTAVPQLKRLGVDVINCSPASALDTFRHAPLEEALNA